MSILILKVHQVKIFKFSKSIDPDEMFHHRPLYLDLQCLMSSF